MTSDDLTMEIHEEIHVKAPIEVTSRRSWSSWDR
jgi:hypothetical protein